MARGLQQIKQELRTAYEAGDKDATIRLVDEYKRADATRRKSLAIAAEMPSATEGMSGLEKFGVGAASGAVNVLRRAGQILTPKAYEEKLGVSDKDIDEQAKYDAPVAGTLPGAVGRFVTEAAITAPVGGAAGKGLLKAVSLLRRGKEAGWLTEAGGLAAEGAAGGELTSGNAGEGAAWNLGLGGALGAAKRLVQGSKNVTPEARRLLDEGVELTPGQMNPRGVVSQLEQGAERVPFVGSFVQDTRHKLMPSAQRRLFEKEFGTSMPESAGFEDMVRETEKRLSGQYDNVRAAARNVKAGGGWDLQKEWQQAVNSPALLVSPEARHASGRWLAGQLDALKARGNVTIEDLMHIRSRLRAEVRKAHQSGQGAAIERADVLEAAEGPLTAQINNALPPQAQQLLQQTDMLYSRFKPLEQAGYKAAARAGGEPTVSQLVGALKQQAGQSRWAGRGAGRNQQFLEDVRDAAETTLRPTGAALPYMAAGGVLSPLVALGMTGVGKRLYSGRTAAQRGGQRLHRAATTTPGVRELLAILRRGAAGPLTDRPEETR